MLACGFLHATAALLGTQATAQAADTVSKPVHLKIVGGFGGVTLYSQLEQPFWTRQIEKLSEGRIKATIQPVDASGLNPENILRLVKIGVVPFATLMLAYLEGEDPELYGLDLPGMNPDVATLRKTVSRYRQHLSDTLRSRHNTELLGVYIYPAQVLFCASAFGSLDDLAGRRIRTASVGQSELVSALGAMPIKFPFNAITEGFRNGSIDCAITGTLPGFEIGLPKVATHIHAMPINWGVSFFGANRSAWEALPADVRERVTAGVADLESRIWARAETDTALGLACSAKSADCPSDLKRPMTVIPHNDRDKAKLSDLLARIVVPRWIERCGARCELAWNRHLAPAASIAARGE